MSDDKWYFTEEQLENSPSRKCGIDSARELSYRQQAANFIQDMGQRLQLSQLCINTAIMYMHRFYCIHSFSSVHRNKLSIAALFLAAKVEEQPRKLEHVIKMAHACLHKDNPQLDTRSEDYTYKLNEAVAYENILLQTLGFDIGIEHPHTYVVKVCQLVKASKDLAQTSYIMATTSLHMTTMCLQFKPTLVACVCIHLACKWSNYRIEKCSEGREWFYYVDKDVTLEMLERFSQRFIEILERSPHRFKRKLAKEGSMNVPRPIDSNPALPGPSTSTSSTDASASNNNRPTAVPIENKSGIVMKKEKDLPESPSIEYTNDTKEKKPVVVKKDPESPKQEENPQLAVVPIQVVKPEHQLPSHSTSQVPNDHSLGSHNQSVDPPEEKPQLPPLPQQHPQSPAVHIPNEHSSSKKSSKESSESSSSKKHKSKHVSKSKTSSSSSSNNTSNHSEPTSGGIKVKIRKDIISLSSVDCNQKYAPAVKAESPKKLLKIKLPKPPPPETPKVEKPLTSLKIVLTKDKSGSGSYSTSHKSEHRESRKRSHGSVVPDGSHHRDHKNSVEPSIKYPKGEQYKKNHSGEQRPSKMYRHSSSHRSDVDNASSSRSQHPAMNENSTFQNYSAVPNYQNSYSIPPPPLPKLKGHNMMGKTNSNFPMLPPLPPPQPPPPPPPPEDI